MPNNNKGLTWLVATYKKIPTFEVFTTELINIFQRKSLTKPDIIYIHTRLFALYDIIFVQVFCTSLNGNTDGNKY